MSTRNRLARMLLGLLAATVLNGCGDDAPAGGGHEFFATVPAGLVGQNRQVLLDTLEARLGLVGCEFELEDMGEGARVRVGTVDAIVLDQVRSLICEPGTLELHRTADPSRDAVLAEQKSLAASLREAEQAAAAAGEQSPGEWRAKQLPRVSGYRGRNITSGDYELVYLPDEHAGAWGTGDYVLIERGAVGPNQANLDAAALDQVEGRDTLTLHFDAAGTEQLCNLTTSHVEGGSDPRRLVVMLNRKSVLGHGSIDEPECAGSWRFGLAVDSERAQVVSMLLEGGCTYQNLSISKERPW